jgi:hypothetical protein
MCWNKEVSLNTFIFSSFVLFNNIWVILFFISFILMQLIEFMIWKNIDNKIENEFYSKIALLLLFLQPVASLMTLKDNVIRFNMILVYLSLASLSIFKFINKDVKSVVSEYGHLKWNFLTKNNDFYIFMCWLVFFLFSFFYNRTYPGLIFGLIMLLLVYYNYSNDGTVGSMWCWVVNSVMIYSAAKLLIYLPFREVIQK